MPRRTTYGVTALLLTLAGCASAPPTTTTTTPTPSVSSSAAAAPSPTPPPGSPSSSVSPGAAPPPWLGTRVLEQSPTGYVAPQPTPRELRRRAFTLPDTVEPLPGTGFASAVVDPAPDTVLARSTWAPGCPVGRADLAWVRLSFRGFDGARHTGELLVDGQVADDVVAAFGALWRADFPIEEMRITTPAEQTAAPTGDGNDTGAFNCRPVRGASTFSQHAYGRAVDVNPFQNPYERSGGEGRVVLPELATSYLDRGGARPGMIEPDGAVVRAFAAIGWEWGGDYRTLKDYQHFSLTGG